MANQTEQEFAATLMSVVNGVGCLTGEEVCDLADVALDEADSLRGMEAASFRESGVMTSNAGLVVRLPGGRSFQVTVVRSR